MQSESIAMMGVHHHHFDQQQTDRWTDRLGILHPVERRHIQTHLVPGDSVLEDVAVRGQVQLARLHG